MLTFKDSFLLLEFVKIIFILPSRFRHRRYFDIGGTTKTNAKALWDKRSLEDLDFTSLRMLFMCHPFFSDTSTFKTCSKQAFAYVEGLNSTYVLASNCHFPFFFSDIKGAYNHVRWRCQHEISIISSKTWPHFVATSDWWSSLKSCVSGGWRLSFWWSLADVFSNLSNPWLERVTGSPCLHGVSEPSDVGPGAWSLKEFFEAGETEMLKKNIWKKTCCYAVLHNSIYSQFPFFFN